MRFGLPPDQAGCVDRPRVHPNSAALRLYNIRDDQPDPPGGSYGRGAGGRLDGRLYEYAEFPLSLPVDATLQAKQWPAILSQLAAFGITTVQNMTFEASRDRAYFAQQAPAVRIRTMPMIVNWSEAGGASVEPHEAVKIIVDGTPVERFAAMQQPYTDDSSTSGRMNLSEAELCAAVRSAAVAIGSCCCMWSATRPCWPRSRAWRPNPKSTGRASVYGSSTATW